MTPSQTKPLVHRDILSLLRHQATERADDIAYIGEASTTVSYRVLCDEVENIAKNIQAECPAARPYRIGIVMENGRHMSSALLAITCIGAALPFDPKLTRAEFESYFAQCEITHLLVGLPDNVAVEAARATNIPVMFFDQLERHDADSSTPLDLPDPQATAMVLLTSGSTGRPKRVPLTHQNVCISAEIVARSVDLTPNDICLSMWELFHVGGLVDLLLAPLHSGGKIITTRGFDAENFFILLKQHEPTWVQVVPTTLREVLQAQRKQPLKHHSLRFIRSVAAELPVTLKKDAEEAFNVPVIQTYGMTEASPLIASTLLPPAINKPGSVGKVCSGEVSILGLDQKPDKMAPEGELIIRGDNVFPGYEGVSEEEHNQSFVGGWYLTGDIAHIEEDGTIYLLGRSKEVINRGGEKINMREVDETLTSHPAVKEAACFAVHHPTLGEDVVAAVILNPSCEAADFKSHVAQSLAAHKVPREVITLNRFPRTPIGKLDRKSLSTLYQGSQSNTVAAKDGDALQQGIAEIWKRVIGVDEINLSDHFLKQGGDSLSAVRMILEVEKAFEVCLPDDILGKLSNIESLAEEVSQAQAANDHGRNFEDKTTALEYRSIQVVIGMGDIRPIPESPIIKGIHLDGRKRPLIWFYNSPATEMLQMSKYMDPDIPIYGCYSGGKVMDGNEEKLWRIAELYAKEITTVFPDGDIHVGGNCRGARVAQKVASILNHQGYKLRSLSLLEFGTKELYELDLPVLCMFGNASSHRDYERLDWGKPGWRDKFKGPAYVVWTKGTHGGFFRKDTIRSITTKLERFLDGQPVTDGSLDHFSSRLILWMHRTRGGYSVFRKLYKLHAYLLYGKRKYYNPLTGRKE